MRCVHLDSCSWLNVALQYGKVNLMCNVLLIVLPTVVFPIKTETDKHRGNREVITQTPASEPATEQDNSLGYKGMVHVLNVIRDK